MLIKDLFKGEFSAGDARLIPPDSARKVQNMVMKNGRYVARKGVDDVDSSLKTKIYNNGTPSKIWSWKPAVRISGRGDYYYLVLYSDNTIELFYQENGWTQADLDDTLLIGSSVTIFSSPDKLLISDGESEPKRIVVNTDGSIDYDDIGITKPTSKPELSNAVYTDETDQTVFSEVGFVRVAYTLVDSNGIESNPSPISDAYNGQRFKYVDEVQTNYIQNIKVSNIEVNDDSIESVRIYTQVTLYSQGEDVSVFSFAVEYPINQGENTFTLYNSGSGITLLSYENDVLKVADNITLTSGVIFCATGDQIYSSKSKFKYLQEIRLQNVNSQTFIDQPVRLRLYAEDNTESPEIQRIDNFYVADFESDDDLDYIRLYDEDLTTPLDVFLVSRLESDKYIEIIAKVTINSNTTKSLYFMFTPPEYRNDYTGSFVESIDGAFEHSITMANKIFRRADVLNADTAISCWADNTRLNGVHVGRINFADGNNDPTDDSENEYPIEDVYNVLPYLHTLGMDINLYSGNRSSLHFNPTDETVSRYFACGRFDFIRSENARVLFYMKGSGGDRMYIKGDMDFIDNDYIDMTFRLLTDDPDGVGTVETIVEIPSGTFNNYIARAADIGSITQDVFPVFVLWSVKIDENTIDKDIRNQTHTLYVYPLYNNEANTIFAEQLTDINGQTTIREFRYGEPGDGGIYIGVTGAILQHNVNLELTERNKEAVRCMANAMPLYLTDVIGRKFGDTDGEQNSNFSLGEQVDFDNLGNYNNYRIRWSDKFGEGFPRLNFNPLQEANTALIPVKGFYDNQYVPTVLAFTENTISRIILDDTTGNLANANKIVTEYSGYGCSSIDLIDVFGDIVFWYSGAKNNLFMYDGNEIKNLSEGKVEFDNPSYLFVNNSTRQVVIVDTNKQYIYSIEYDQFYSATGLDVQSATNVNDGKSLMLLSNDLAKEYPSENNTTETTILQTKSYKLNRELLHRVRPVFEGSAVSMATGITYPNNIGLSIDNGEVSSLQSYGVNKRGTYFNITLTGLTAFEELDAETRKL